MGFWGFGGVVVVELLALDSDVVANVEELWISRKVCKLRPVILCLLL